MDYLKDETNELRTNRTNIRNLYRRIHEFKSGYQPRSNLVKDENGNLADSYNILDRWKSISLLFNVCKVSDVEQIEIHALEQLAPDHSLFDWNVEELSSQ
jgi:hypothetical protein